MLIASIPLNLKYSVPQI